MRIGLSSLIALVASLSPALACADAIEPFDGECPPGTDRGIEHHSEACIPRSCEDDGACGSGASCNTLCTCRAMRTLHSDGRVAYDPPREMEVEIALCRPDGTCADGQVASRKQCEPDDETPAFDRERHRWTRVSHPGGCAGCAVPRGSRGGAGVVGLALAVALWRARRR
ncbi:MAG: hypothetical protein AB7S26_18705 [Sandaracinaceae bacterium]